MDFIKINSILEYNNNKIEITLVDGNDFETVFHNFYSMIPEEQKNILASIFTSDKVNIEHITYNEIDLDLMSKVEIEWKKGNIHLRKSPLFSITKKVFKNKKFAYASLNLGAWFDMVDKNLYICK